MSMSQPLSQQLTSAEAWSINRAARALVLSTVVVTASNAIAAPADLDPAFGTDGIATIETHSMATSVLAFADGRLAVLVRHFARADPLRTSIVALRRDGRLDSGFTPIEAVDVPNRAVSTDGFALDATERIVVLHQLNAYPIVGVMLTLHAPDGTLDASYAQSGRTREFTFLRGGPFFGPVLDPAGVPHFVFSSSILIVGSSGIGRVSADGLILDGIGVNSDGFQGPSLPTGFDAYHSFVFQPDGKLVALVYASDKLRVVRFDGRDRDPTFADAGLHRSNAPAETQFSKLLMATDGGIIAVGTTRMHGRPQIIAAKLTPAGQIDGTFGNQGYTLVPVGRVGEVVNAISATLQPDGRIVVATTTNSIDANRIASPRIVVTRLSVDGSVDHRFAPGGAAEIWSDRGSEVLDVMVRPDGRIVIAGSRWTAIVDGQPVQRAALYQLAGGDLPEARPLAERKAVEYFNQAYGHYFLSTDPEEIMALDTAVPRAWTRTGRSFRVWASADAGLSPVCRFWSDQTFAPKSSHVYTPYANECAHLKAGTDWRFERDAFFVRMPQGFAGAGTCGSDSQPLFRAYNNGLGGAPNHRYTVDAALLDAMIAEGWTFEGEAQTRVFACVPVQ